jgi:predicted lipid-binding transport protein (Tim44 family)
MKKIILPSPPQPTFLVRPVSTNQDGFSPTPNTRVENSDQAASNRLAPLDAAFLRRVHRTTLWFGALITLCVLGVTHSMLITTSFGGGALLGGLLLKSQEITVSRALRKPASSKKNWAAILPMSLAPLVKYLLVGVLLSVLFHRGHLHVAAFATGIMVVQFVVVAKVIGRLMARQMRSVREVYIVQGKSNAC